MIADAPRPVGPSDFHDGYVLSALQTGNEVRVTIRGASGKCYEVCFEGVHSMESESPKGMLLYAMYETIGEPAPLRRCEFVNWYYDEPVDERSKAYLRITANRFTVTEVASDQNTRINSR